MYLAVWFLHLQILCTYTSSNLELHQPPTFFRLLSLPSLKNGADPLQDPSNSVFLIIKVQRVEFRMNSFWVHHYKAKLCPFVKFQEEFSIYHFVPMHNWVQKGTYGKRHVQ